jgi:hypothetical protein
LICGIPLGWSIIEAAFRALNKRLVVSTEDAAQPAI